MVLVVFFRLKKEKLMPKKRKSKKNKKVNVVDSRIKPIEHDDPCEKERLELFRKTQHLPGFFITYNITNAYNKHKKILCIAGITAYTYKFSHCGGAGKVLVARKELGDISHAWIELVLINNNFTIPFVGASVVSMGKYTRTNNTTSLRFTYPKPLEHAELVGLQEYYNLFWEDKNRGAYETKFLIEKVCRKKDKVLNNYTHLSSKQINIYEQQSKFLNFLSKCSNGAQNRINIINQPKEQFVMNPSFRL